MHRRDGATLFSASDLVNFMGCAHASVLDLRNLEAPAAFPADGDQAKLLQEKGLEHERAYLQRLRDDGREVVDVSGEGSIAVKAERTRAALRSGADVIYQGAFLASPWLGYSDFLLKVPLPSALGPFSYEVADTKLARTAKPKHVMQMAVYGDILATEQGVVPERMHVVLGDGGVATVRTDECVHYFRFARDRFLAHAATPSGASVAEPCGHCAFCRWSERCEAGWQDSHHLSIIAGMTRGRAAALRDAGFADMGALATASAGIRVNGVQPEAFEKARSQAGLQMHQRRTGERVVELLTPQAGRGLDRLPAPDPGDMFLDFEGDPLFDGGLEYLIGIVDVEAGSEQFHAFWAHDRDEEKHAFQQAVDYMTARLSAHPNAFIYHYASYEETALKKLAMLHGTREAEVDDLLRGRKLVDLYKVLREAIRTSEPNYSIKSMEKFYLGEKRGGEVTTAGDSIVIYERWRRLGDPKLLEDIGEYNRIDCSSTRACRDWLAGMRDPSGPWFEHRPERGGADSGDERGEAERRVAEMADQLLAGREGGQGWRQLAVDLLEFHRRESKPAWWSMFSKQDMEEEQLLDDAECLAGLQQHPDVPPRRDKRSSVVACRFPAQDFKLKVGDEPLRAGTLEPAGTVVAIDEDDLSIELRLGPSRSPIADGTALIPSGPVGDRELRAAVWRYAEAVRDGLAERYGAVTSVLRRDLPRLVGRPAGTALVDGDSNVMQGIIEALLSLDRSHLIIQGPPGAGKTWTSAQAIVALLARGMRIGVASNGHKAINQLLFEIEALATAQGLRVRGIKKSGREDQKLGTGGWIEETTSNRDIGPEHQLVAGTAWLWSRPEHDQAFDYLFVDEAGQVGLANIVAMGVAARNVVLVGDPMQLSQPVQGTHPRGSGASALEHLLGEAATVSPERGVFLAETRRMHPDLCAFVSAAAYDGRLRSVGTEGQRLLAPVDRDREAIARAGLRFVFVESEGCTQRSVAEAERLDRTYRALLGTAWVGPHGREEPVGIADILVVSPYNMQVELLKKTLPAGARVGTVDKFQGQEAAVVLVSMATSSGEDLPRDIGFLYSRNRLNVAISRARCLAVIFASPRLLEVPCSTLEQMRLVNGLCRAASWSEASRRANSA